MINTLRLSCLIVFDTSGFFFSSNAQQEREQALFPRISNFFLKVSYLHQILSEHGFCSVIFSLGLSCRFLLSYRVKETPPPPKSKFRVFYLLNVRKDQKLFATRIVLIKSSFLIHMVLWQFLQVTNRKPLVSWSAMACLKNTKGMKKRKNQTSYTGAHDLQTLSFARMNSDLGCGHLIPTQDLIRAERQKLTKTAPNK